MIYAHNCINTRVSGLSSNALWKLFSRNMHCQVINLIFTASLIAVIPSIGSINVCETVTPYYANESAIISKNYPEDYSDDYNCQSTIVVPSNQNIWLKFDGRFEIEQSTSNGECFDFVKIYKGYQISDRNLIGTYCGTAAPPQFIIRHHVATVVFKSDDNVGKSGFLLSWTPCSKSLNLLLDSGCQSPKLQQGMIGTFSSINFPTYYENNIICLWEISAPTHYKNVILEFHKNFYLEKSSRLNICYDFLKVFDYKRQQETMYCGNYAPRRIVIYGNKARVTFQTDNSNNYYGFQITWTAFSENRPPLLPLPQMSGCGGLYRLKGKGSFTSHKSFNGQTEYPNYTYCSWLLSGTGPIVHLKFEDFNLERESNSQCVDSVTVYDGNNESPQYQIGEILCGTVELSTIVSNQNLMLVIFRTDGTLEKTGFQANFW